MRTPLYSGRPLLYILYSNQHYKLHHNAMLLYIECALCPHLGMSNLISVSSLDCIDKASQVDYLINHNTTHTHTAQLGCVSTAHIEVDATTPYTLVVIPPNKNIIPPYNNNTYYTIRSGCKCSPYWNGMTKMDTYYTIHSGCNTTHIIKCVGDGVRTNGQTL